MRHNAFLCAYAVIFVYALLPVLASADGTVTQSTPAQFSAGQKTQVQIDGSQLELFYQWQQLFPLNSPQSRTLAALTCTSGTPEVVLFGGEGQSGNALGDTWVFDTVQNVWADATQQIGGPSARFGHSMATLNGTKILLFGGQLDGSTYSNETWIYDTVYPSTWTTKSYATMPSKRAYASMATDTQHAKIILFGGKCYTGIASSETWVYDEAALTWSLKSPPTAPSPRQFAAMAFDGADGKIYLYGGMDNSGTVLKDFWTYDVTGNTWSQIAQDVSDSPPQLQQACLAFDTQNQKIFLFGGFYNGTYYNKVWYYAGGGKWYRSDPPNPQPAEREAWGMSYMPEYGKAFLFGGRGDSFYQDTWYLTYRSTGSFISAYFDVPYTTSIQWKKIQWTPTGQADALLSVKVWLSASDDNITWDDFRGSDGTIGTLSNYYGGAAGQAIYPIYTNKRYIKYKLYLESDKLPLSPQLTSITLTYNRAPNTPTPLSPVNYGSTNSMTPTFTWYNTTDPDGDPVTYEIHVATDTTFASLLFASTGIAQGNNGTTVFASTTTMSEGQWFWRVRAVDNGGFPGAWSSESSVFVDTTPPSAINSFTAIIGSINGSIDLSWTAPGNNGLSGSVVNGEYDVRCATFCPLTEDMYLNPSMYPGVIKRTGVISFSPGFLYRIPITGLADATTYYVAIKVADEAGNFSAISPTSPGVLTNAPPTVMLLSPTGGERWSDRNYIVWISSDQNPGDTVTFDLAASCDSGATYDVIIATGLSTGTTSFLWNTYQACNGPDHRVKIVARDARGLTGESISSSDFDITNPNKAPQVTVDYPVGGEVFSSTVTIRWSVFDENLSDTHSYDLYFSSDNGNSYGWHFQTLLSSYSINTLVFPNGPRYRLKVIATDSGVPPLQGTGVPAGSFIINNNNYPPGAFKLLSPQDGASSTVFDFIATWEVSHDPNPEDNVTYTLIYSSDSAFKYSVTVSSLAVTSYRINPATLQDMATYYWKIIANDPLGLETMCQQPFKLNMMSRFQAISPDALLFAEITDGLPANSYIKIENVDRSMESVQHAEADTVKGRQLRSVGGNVYRIYACDIDGNEKAASAPQLTVTYTFQGGGNYYGNTLVPINNMRCALLDEEHQRWVTASSLPSIDAKSNKISSSLDRMGIITMLGSVTPLSKVSGIVNYPNPFYAGRQDTKIRYILTEDSSVSASIYTLTGDLVWTKEYSAGKEGGKGQASGYTNEIAWDGRNNAGMIVANGMYICEIKAGGERQLRKIGVVKQ